MLGRTYPLVCFIHKDAILRRVRQVLPEHCGLIRSAGSSRVGRERLGTGVTGGLRTHRTRGWTLSDCQVEQVRPPWNVAPVSGSATARQFSGGCWPAPPRPPKLRTARGPWPGSASSPGRETAPRCGPRCPPETLPLFERPAALQGCLLRGLLSTSLGDAHLAHSGLLAVVHIVGTVKAPIAGVQLGRMLEDLLMTVQRSLHLGAVGGIAVQNLIVGDQALGTLGQEDLVTELHRLALLAPLDQVRVGLEDGVHFLVSRNRLSVQHPPTGLINDLLAQVAVSRDLLAELVHRHAAEHVDTFDLCGLLDDRARAFQHLSGDPE